jgi:peptidyl-prolyl cis-trans isomerase B (cyclophilin B)
MTMKLTRTVAALGIVAVAVTQASCTRHKSGATDATASASTAAASTSTLPPVAPVTGPKLPPFFPSPAVGANCQYPRTAGPSGKQAAPPPSGKASTVPGQIGLTLVTDRGRIPLLLANNESPCTVSSFINLAQQAYFDNTECHRLTTARALSVLQCGDPNGDGTGGPGYQFANEFPTVQYPPGEPALQVPVVYPKGTLAMANAGPGTNGSQFFMVYRDSLLPPTYTIFGTVSDAGLAVIDKIASGGVAGGGDDGKPVNEVTITSARRD